MNAVTDTYLPDILNTIAQGLLVPTMIVIVLLLIASIFFIGQIIVEAVTERRHYKQNMAAIVNDINDAPYDDVSGIIEASSLLNFQKAALLTASRNMGLPEDSLFALAQTQITKAEKHYQHRLAWTDTISKIGPMLGLMGTLIPLGPGIVALGQNNTALLSASLGIAFDATVCGLVCAVVSLIISKIRQGWYNEYISTVESIMTCVLEKATAARKDGVTLSANYTGDALRELRDAAKAPEPAASAASAAPVEPAVDSAAEEA